MVEIVIFVVILISCFISGFCFGFRIKQRLYEALLKSWENTTKSHQANTRQLLMDIVNGYDGILNTHREVLSMVERNDSNTCAGCEYINTDSGYCYDCYNCSKKYVKDGGSD